MRSPALAFERVASAATVGAGLLCLFLLSALWTASDAGAAFPGENGRIAYSAEVPGGESERVLWTVNPDGTQPLQLTSGPWDDDPAYSPDGSRIAFMRDGDLMVANSDGTGVTRLVDGYIDAEEGVTWEEDFEDPETEEIIDLVRIDAFSETWKEIMRPAFSPDGSSLAVEYDSGYYKEQDVCAVEIVGEETCIPDGEPGHYSEFFNECACDGDLASISSTTGAVLDDQLPAGSLEEPEDPTYSTDGKLAFTAMDEGGPRALYVVGSPGAPAQPILSEVGGSADFSPDGSRMVVVAYARDELFLVDAANGEIDSVISIPPKPEVEHVELEDPVFSPDGTRIAVDYEGHGEGPDLEALFTVGLDGSGLATVVGDDAVFAWQPVQPPAPPAPTAALAPIAKAPDQAEVSSIKHVKLDRKGRGTIGWVVCGSSPCTPRVVSAKLKVGKRKFSVKVRVSKRLAPGKRAKIRVKVKGKALAALKRKGKGRLTTRVRAGKGLKPKKLRSTVVSKRRGQRKAKGAGR